MTDEQRRQTGWIGVLGWFRDRNYESGYLGSNHPLGRRLIIRHGERVTRHEVTDKAIVIGRDPGCDLFFSDHKLSRRHARMELEAGKLKLVDLGSRNGCWVNEKRVDECILESSDALRLGGLRISYEEDLPITRSDGDSGTIQLKAPGGEGRQGGVEPPDDTMLFVASSPPDKERTIVLSESVPESEDTGTVVFARKGEAGTTTRSIPVIDKTKPLAEESEESEDDVPPLTDRTVSPQVDGKPLVIDGLKHRGSSTVPLLVLAGTSLLVYLLLAVPLLFKARYELFQESLHRGKTLFSLLRTSNAQLLGMGQIEGLSVEAVLSEPGVKEALILTLDGRIAAPRDRAGEIYDIIDGVAPPVREVDRFQQSETGSGDLVFVGPLVHEGRRAGVAVMIYSVTPMAKGIWMPLLVVVGLFVIVAGAIAAYALDKSGSIPSSSKDSETTFSQSPAPAREHEATNSFEREDG